MLTSTEIANQLDRILPRVQKPGRYFGGEYNQVLKDWRAVKTHIALVFPDLYDLGLPNLGLAILYDLLNQRADILAERAYSPWLDMEEQLRQTHLPLYSLESKTALAAFDIIGFSLPYESIYTNVLNILDLAGLPLRSSDRTTQHPLIIAGGHAAFNPEPMSAFIDAFLIGEGEEVIMDVVHCHQTWKQSGAGREQLLVQMAKIPGVYVPALYDVLYNADNTIQKIQPQSEGIPSVITRRLVDQLPPPPTRFLVPSIDVSHNRIAVEIMRGCTRGCRFCQAGMINRPIRERPVEEVMQSIETALDATGYEEISLLSLSSSDYTHITELVQLITERLKGRHVSVTLPSLRIESFSVELMDQLKDLRPGGGFTMAPEAATERMRQIINKPASMEQILETTRAVFAHGWTSVKLYFMIGHPDETMEDVQAIVDLCRAVLKEGRKLVGGRAQVHAGVSTFIPKPHTPFQWVSCDSVDQILEKQSLLRRELRANGFKLTWVDPEVTLLEGWLSRGDRRTADVIQRAWELGCKFDAWQDQYHHGSWLQAFSEMHLEPEFYTHRQRNLDEVLPWSHISTGVRPSYLKREYLNSQKGILRPDCRQSCFGCGSFNCFSSTAEEK